MILRLFFKGKCVERLVTQRSNCETGQIQSHDSEARDSKAGRISGRLNIPRGAE